MKKVLISLFLTLMISAGAFAMTYNEAKKQEKPVVIMFHMHGCSACKQFTPIFEKISSKYSNKFCFVKEDIDHSDIAKTLNFTTVPAFFIVEPKTMKAKRIEDNCAWDKSCFAKELEKY